ncbi:MAG: sigma-70 family RNA polymerase sigma factor [Rhodospirillaceae bacterium]|nr:sigma-70 family RNA polymerase sigma factor [Rhodospirillaceae bacterium]
MSEDEALLKRIEGGDEQAFQMLMSLHLPRFFRLAYRFLLSKADAEDVVQDCFLKLWRDAKDWPVIRQRPQHFTSWFYRVVANRCIDQLRQPKMVEIDEDLIHASPFLSHQSGQLSPEKATQQKEMERHVQLALASLPDRQRMAFNLCFYEGLSYYDAAEILGVTLKSLESLMIRARQKLKKKLLFLL